MKYEFIGILCNIFVMLETGFSATAGSCGKLEFEQQTVTEGDSAKLIYSPHNLQGSRRWLKEGYRQTNLYDSSNPSHNENYIEHKEGDKYTLQFTKVEKANTGSYIVYCGNSAFSDRTKLTVMSLGCGNLRAQTNNIAEGETAKFVFDIDPGRKFVWEKKINSTFKQLVMTDRYKTLEGTNKQIHYLRIYRSEYIESGEYRVKCDPAVSNSVHLNIVPTAPSDPVFQDVVNIDDCKSCISAQLNVKVAVECFVTGGSEPIDLNILKNGKLIPNVTRRNSTEITFVRHDYVPTTADFGLPFTCTVKNPALTIEKVNSAVLYIRVQPKTVVLKKVNSVTENQSSDIECMTTEGRPPVKSDILFGGFKANNTETKEVRTGHTYTVTTTTTRLFNRFDNQQTIECCSTILNRSCSNKETLNVKFPPRKVSITELKEDNQDNGDTEVTLKCSVEESNPKSSIEWKGIKNVQRTQSDKGTTYHNSTRGWTFNVTWMLNLTKEDNYRSITCVVRNQAFPDLALEHSYRPNITYFPAVTISGDKSKVAYLGDDVSLSCNVDSNPASLIKWYNETGHLIEELYGAAYLDLHLANISLEHSQTYKCTADNTIGGMKSTNVTLIVNDPSEKPVKKPMTESDSPSVVGPVIGCSIVIVAAAVIGLVVFRILRKKRQNASLERKPTYEVKIEERKPSVHPVGNEPIYNNTAAASGENEAVEDQPEYASVVPKKERGEVKAAENKSPKNVREDNLVYAELDLVQDSDKAVSRPLVPKDEPTEYVSIDFSKTGTVTKTIEKYRGQSFG